MLNTCAAGEYSYASNDLLVPHPTLEGYWKFHGRVDDQIVHSTGEKVLNFDPRRQVRELINRIPSDEHLPIRLVRTGAPDFIKANSDSRSDHDERSTYPRCCDVRSREI